MINKHRRRTPTASAAPVQEQSRQPHRGIAWLPASNAAGLTLLEMLIAMILGTIVLIGLAGVAGPFFRQAGRATIDADRQYQMQQALTWLTRTIEEAGWSFPGPDGVESIVLVTPDTGRVRHFYTDAGTLWLDEQGELTRIVDDVLDVAFFPQVDMVSLVLELGNSDYNIQRSAARAMRNLQFAADWRFTEMTGDVIFDNSPFNHNGAVYFGDWIAGPDGGGALSFDGSDSFVEIPYTPRLELTDRMGIIADVQITAASGHQTIFNQGELPATQGVWLYLDDDSVVYAYRSDGSIVSVASPSLTWSTGQWYRIMVQHDDVENTVRLYRDETEIQMASGMGAADKGGLTTANGQIFLGAYQGSTTRLQGALGRISLIRF